MNSNAINPLPTNKTVVFFSPIEGKDVLVRTGIDSDLLNCVLTSYSKKFLFLTKEKKERALNKLKTKLEKKFDVNKIKPFYTAVKNKRPILVFKDLIKNQNDKIVFETIFDILSFQEIEKNMNSSSSAKKYLEPKLKDIPSKQKEYCLQKFSELFKEEKEHDIQNITTKLKRNLFFIDSKTRLPYKVLDKVDSQKSMIIMKVGNGFEIVGRLLSGNVVQREFKFDDPLIKRIYTFLYEPSEIPKKYPELTAYTENKLEKKPENKIIKKKSKSSSSSSESEESDSETQSKRKSSSPNLRSNSESPSTLQSLEN